MGDTLCHISTLLIIICICVSITVGIDTNYSNGTTSVAEDNLGGSTEPQRISTTESSTPSIYNQSHLETASTPTENGTGFQNTSSSLFSADSSTDINDATDFNVQDGKKAIGGAGEAGNGTSSKKAIGGAEEAGNGTASKEAIGSAGDSGNGTASKKAIAGAGEAGNGTASKEAIGGAEEVGNGTVDLYILGLLGFSGAWPSGRTTLVSAQMALEQVNSREDVLPGYKLHLIWNDTKCDPGVAVDVMYHSLYRQPTKLMILGAGCSIASEPTARSSHLWNLVQVSSASASPALSDKKAYPNFLRLTSPDTLINPAKVALLQGFGWSKVATIHETYELFSKVTDDFVARANDANMTVLTSEIFTDNPNLQVQNLKRHDARIIVTGFYVDNAVRVFCKAFKEGIVGQKYVWIVPGFFGADWWKKSYPDLECTQEELLQATEGHFEFNFAFMNPTQKRGIAGVTSQEWRTEFDRRLGNETPAGTAEAPSAFDAIWAMALALNQTSLDLQAMDKRLEEFNYVDDVTLRLLRSNLWNITFLGVSGDVFFDVNGDSPLPVVVRQQQGGILIDVGYFLPGEVEIRPIPSAPIKWVGGVPPRDATTYLRMDDLVSGATYTIIISVAGVGVVGALIFLGFNIIFRKNKVIKMSSPTMNNIILIGCIVTYVTVTLQEVSAAYVSVLCKLRNLTLMIGFSLSFGSLFAKTWRVYRIFTNKTKKITLKDVQLIGIVFILVCADVIIFVVRETLDPYQVQTLDLTSEVIENGDLVVIKRTYLCTCTYDLYFQGVIYTIKGLLLVFGAFLAWQTRKVSIPGLNDSHYIGLCIYNVAVLSILGVIINFVLKEVELRYIFTSGFIIFSTTMTQLIIFVPKVMKLRSFGNQVDDSTTGTTATTATIQAPSTSHLSRSGSDHLGVRHNVRTYELLKELEKTKEELTELRQRFGINSEPKLKSDVYTVGTCSTSAQ